jgi:SAM-dependent methyltransferase
MLQKKNVRSDKSLKSKINMTIKATEGVDPKGACLSGAGDFDYDRHGQGYAQQRRTDPRIASLVHVALGTARRVLNVGAGAGSYEPSDRYVIAIEPAAAMRAQRPAHLVPAIHGVAERLPLDEQSMDASMAMVTVHQWRDLRLGLKELCRVTRDRIVILTFDGEALERFWLADYAPELISAERGRYPAIGLIQEILGGHTEVKVVPVPVDCIDGFTEAFYARPERFLEAQVRRSQSAWGFVKEGVQERFVKQLSRDLESGAWDQRYGHWRRKPFFEGALRLITNYGRGTA